MQACKIAMGMAAALLMIGCGMVRPNGGQAAYVPMGDEPILLQVGLLDDLYDIDMADRTALEAHSAGGLMPLTDAFWFAAWRSRTPERWAELGERYRFRYVLAPTSAALELEAVLTDGVWALHRVR